jgi:hypothetical protein
MKRNIFLPFFVSIIMSLLFSCTKELSVENGQLQGDAVGSLKDSVGNCFPDSVHGTFYNGVLPGPDTAYIEIQVQVDTAGAYNIYTELENGFMFADSGFFNTTGINTIKLKPIGTPILQKVTDFAVHFDTSTCYFAVNVADSTGTGLGGGGNPGGGDTTDSWEFTTDSGHFQGPVDLAILGDTLGLTYLAIQGFTAGDSVWGATVIFPGDSIVTGSYTTQGTPFPTAIFGFSDQNNNTIYYAVNDASSSSLITINITSYDSATRIVTGTFSGLANDSAGNATVNVTNGHFTAEVSP